MKILLSRTRDRTELSMDDVADLRRLSVIVNGIDRRDLETGAVPAVAVFAGLGRAQGLSHVFVPVSRIRDLAGSVALDVTWNEEFTRMIEFASDHGWVDATGALRAHVEWASTDG